MSILEYNIPKDSLDAPCKEFVEIFQKHFGEDRIAVQLTPEGRSVLTAKNISTTDIKSLEEACSTGFRLKRREFCIIIHFPKALVENEQNKVEPIYDLFVRIIPYCGDVVHALRTTYTEAQLKSRYVHSHLPRLYECPRWEQWCLGSGPIRHTLDRLSRDNPEPGLIGLLCLELETLVATESLSGGPYIRMEEVHGGSTVNAYFNCSFNLDNPEETQSLRFRSDIVRNWFKEFLTSGELKLKLNNSLIELGCSMLDLFIDATNSFIRYLEKHSYDINNFMGVPGSNNNFRSDFFEEYIIKDGELRKVYSDNVAPLLASLGKTILTFKDEEFKMKMINGNSSPSHSLWLFDPEKVFKDVMVYIMYLNDEFRKSNSKVK